MVTLYTLDRYAFYQMLFNPYTNSKPFAQSGEPERIDSLSVVGSGTLGDMAPQVAVTVTEKTAFPQNWGRFYLPGPSGATADLNGHIKAATVNSIADVYFSAAAALQGNQIFPVVPMTQAGGQPARGLLSVSQCQVDDVFDVVRRRRSHTTLLRAKRPSD